MRFPIIEFEQNGNQLFCTCLPFNIINKYSDVLIYGRPDGEGYQRVPEPKHYKKIEKYIKDNKNFIFPTSIILGIDRNILDKISVHEENITYLDFSKINDSFLFRIIDGQHRIRGLQEAAKKDNSINLLKLSVVVYITPPNKRSIEMNIFNTINSTSKRIKVDLIELAKYNYRVLEGEIKPTEVISHISIQVAKIFNESKDFNNKWLNAIKFGIHNEEKVGALGVSAFMESIESIVGYYLTSNKFDVNLSGLILINFTQEASKDISKFLLKAWEAIYLKWSSCFNEKEIDIDIYDDVREFYYNSDYYIQKTLGAKSINYLIARVINRNQKVLNNSSLEEFKQIIEKSDLLSSDWKIGGRFSGYSSESAFNKVSKLIERIN